MFYNTIKSYFTLIRLPNLFTVISNILVGYFLVFTIHDVDIYSLSYLFLVSIFLYIGGVVMNDLFDIKLDKSERPDRPLPSNQITKKNAIIICIFTLTISAIVSLFLNLFTFFTTISMIFLIFVYNYKTKSTKWRSITLGTIRSLNIFLGSSIFINNLNQNMLPFIIILTTTFFYIFAIGILSKNESKKIEQTNTISSSFLIVYIIIFSIFILIVFEIDFFNFIAIINLIIFLILIVYYHLNCIKKNNDPYTIQWTVKNLIISIIIFDSIFITGLIGMYGFATLLLLIPSIILSKETSVT